MEKICIESFSKSGLTFVEGVSYKIDYNSINGKIYIYTIWGYTDISKSILNRHFL